MPPVAGAELVLVVDGAGQFPKRDLTASGCVAEVVTEVLLEEEEEGVPVRVLAKPGKADGATVVLLVKPNIEGVLLEETVDDGLVVVRDDGCPKPPPAVVLAKMGLKFWTAGLLSEGGAAEEEEVEVVTEKMGLNPEDSRGLAVLVILVLMGALELLIGAAAAADAAVTGLDAVKAVGVLV